MTPGPDAVGTDVEPDFAVKSGASATGPPKSTPASRATICSIVAAPHTSQRRYIRGVCRGVKAYDEGGAGVSKKSKKKRKWDAND
jgi:hypothetical protein